MIDKIILIDKHNLTIIFTDKIPFSVYSSEGEVLRLASWLLGIELAPEETTCVDMISVAA